MSLIPEALKRGQCVAFVSPSARLQEVFPLRIERAKSYLSSRGYTILDTYSKIADDASLQEDARQRAAEINEAFSNSNVAAIITTIGGLTANEIVPYLDYELIAKNPKIFVGYSDITILHHALYVGSGLRTFYGPSVITQFGEYPEPMQFTMNSFNAVLGSATGAYSVPSADSWTDEFLDWGGEPENLRPRTLVKSAGWKWLRHGKATGLMWGGCLPSVQQLFGTKWEVDYKGKIVLLELPEGVAPNVGFSLDSARRCLADLALRGVWTKINGLILGRPYKYSHEEIEQWERLVLRSTESYNFPILARVDCGHTDPILTIPLGCPCSLDSHENKWEFLEPSVV